MVYNRFSYRQWLRWPGMTLRAALGAAGTALESQRKAYDANAAGESAPETVFTSCGRASIACSAVLARLKSGAGERRSRYAAGPHARAQKLGAPHARPRDGPRPLRQRAEIGGRRALRSTSFCFATGRAWNADASTITDHLDAFQRFSSHRVQELSFLRELPASLDLSQFDALVIHYSIAIGYLGEHYISAASRARVRDFSGLEGAVHPGRIPGDPQGARSAARDEGGPAVHLHAGR